MTGPQRAQGERWWPGARGGRVSCLFLLGVLCAFVVSYLLFFHRLADRDLWSSHEARAAMDAQSILDGDWGLPHLNDGRAELQKPPLYYWLVALIARLRGGAVDAWAVRLPAALSAPGCVVLLAWFGQRIGRPRTGLLAAIILATAVHFTWLARIGRIDMPLTLAESVACVMFYLAGSAAYPVPSTQSQRLSFLIVGYVAVAVAVLLKGPVGLVLPVVIMTAHRLCNLRTRYSVLRPPLSLWWGIPLVLALTLPWFVWANAATDGEFFRVFLWYHNVERGLGGSTLRSHPWWLYLPYFVNDFLPWSPLLIAAMILAVRRGWWRSDPEARFGLLWLAAVIGILSCASFKRADYLLPAYPGAALFLACITARLAQTWQTHRFRILALRVVLMLIPVCAIVGWTWRVERQLPEQEAYRDYRRFAAAVRELAPAPETVLFFRTEAHALAFHIGRPLAVVVEWEELQARLAARQGRYVVMPTNSAAELSHHLEGVRLRKVLSNTELSGGQHERSLILFRVDGESPPCPTSLSCRRSPTNR